MNSYQKLPSQFILFVFFPVSSERSVAAEWESQVDAEGDLFYVRFGSNSVAEPPPTTTSSTSSAGVDDDDGGGGGGGREQRAGSKSKKIKHSNRSGAVVP